MMENLVYITSSNAKSIIHKIDLDDIEIDKRIYKIDIKWFSPYEVKSLLAFKLLYEDPIMFFQKYTKRQNIDTKEFVYEGISPAYHYSISCNRMLSDYLNYRLPKEIKERGDKVIEEFRRWFKEHKDVLEDNPDQFLDKMQEKYNFKEKPKIKDLKKKFRFK